MNSERKAFEEYFKTTWEGTDLIQTVGEDYAFKLFDEKYVESIVEKHWRTWQASTQRQGYKLVPLQPDDHMKATVRDFYPDVDKYEVMSKYDWEELFADVYKAMIGAVDE